MGIQDKAGLTPLHWAPRQGRTDVARILIGCGADVTVKDKDGLTPLHWAWRQGRIDLARFLVDYDVGATVQDKDGLASTMPWQDTSAAAELRTGEAGEGPLIVDLHPGPKMSLGGARARNGDGFGQAKPQGT